MKCLYSKRTLSSCHFCGIMRKSGVEPRKQEADKGHNPYKKGLDANQLDLRVVSSRLLNLHCVKPIHTR